MSLDQPEALNIDGRDYRFAIVAARFNRTLVEAMLEHCIHTLAEARVEPGNIEVMRVPGSNELPYAAAMLAKSFQYDAVIALGLVLAGETPHHEVIADSTGHALQRVAIDTEIPVINGVVVVHTEAQAEARCRGELNRGREFAQAALEMAAVKQALVARLDELDAHNAANDPEKDEPWDGFSSKGNPWKL
jgi:6,7-dimethyl-8-ribityllumazine synthase